MRKFLIAAAAALVVSMMPAGATEDEPEPTEPCEESSAHEVLTPDGANEDVEPAVVPAFPHDILEEPYREEAVVQYFYRLDVSGQEDLIDAKSAVVDVSIDWGNDGDFDLYVYDADGILLDNSVAFNPLDGAGESVFLGTLPHCTDLQIDIVNYLAPPTLDMTLDVDVMNLRN